MDGSLKQKSKSVFIELSRINEWAIISISLTLFVFLPNMYVSNAGIVTPEIVFEVFTSLNLYIALIIVFMAQIFLFASNDYYDRNVDALDEGKRQRNPVCAGRVTEKEVKGLLIVTAIIPLVLSLYFNLYAFLLTAFTLFVFFFYTAEPLRFKNKVGLDVLSHATLINSFPYIFSLVALGYYVPGIIYLLIIIMLRSAIAQILQEVRDHDIDKKAETNTVIYLGQKKAVWLVFSIWLTMTVGSAVLLLTYQLFGVGISPFYLFVIFITLSYAPTFYKLIKADNYSEIIEKQWMGQGRTNKQLGLSYGLPVMVYLFILFFVLI